MDNICLLHLNSTTLQFRQFQETIRFEFLAPKVRNLASSKSSHKSHVSHMTMKNPSLATDIVNFPIVSSWMQKRAKKAQ